MLSDGLSSRLHRSLVYEQQIAQSAMVRYHPAEVAGQFTVQITAAPGHELTAVEAALDLEMQRMRQDPPTDEEITRSKNRLEATHFRQLARIGGFGGRADQLNHFNVMARDPSLINTSLDSYLAVQRDDILRVHESVLNQRQVRLRVFPETSLKPASSVTVDRTVMPQPDQEPAFTPPAPLRHRLDNGLEIAVVEQQGLPVVCFGLLLKGGASADPADLPGLASFTAQMLTEGTINRTSQEIASAFEFLGAHLSADARREYTLLATETLSKHWTNALELMAEVAMHPTFPAHEIERVRRETLADLKRGKDDPAVVAERMMTGLVFRGETGYGHPIHGTEEALTALTREDVTKTIRAGLQTCRRHFNCGGRSDFQRGKGTGSGYPRRLAGGIRGQRKPECAAVLGYRVCRSPCRCYRVLGGQTRRRAVGDPGYAHHHTPPS